ncbi:MAG TPA: SDR family oxidoreductase [Abditibacteriaceae bacterium]|jgi:3-oxoacyl-[acyl-carrier protein] reductase
MRQRVVLVTGGTGAIGGEIVRALCRDTAQCWRVVANYARDEARARALQAETGCELHRADVGSEEQVGAMFAATSPLFAVIHAAGASRNALMLSQTHDDWHESLRVNATGSFLVARGALASLQDGGRLVLLASRVGESGNAGQGAYAASKAAVIALAKVAAREGGEMRICANAICPGFVPSALTASLPVERLDEFRRRSVLDEFGTGAHVASAVQWLLSDEGAGVSGQVVHCDSRI